MNAGQIETMSVRRRLIGATVLLGVIACSTGDEERGGNAADVDASDTTADAPEDVFVDGLGVDAEVGTDPSGLPCPGRDPICDAPTTPLATDLGRGIVGVAVYQSDWIRCPYGANCYQVPFEVFVVVTDALVGSSDEARTVLDTNPTSWQRVEDRFELETAEGPHLLCERPTDIDYGFVDCAAIDFGPDLVLTTVLWTTYGPGALYVVRNVDGTQLPTFSVPTA